MTGRNIARLLAPLALATTALALFLIVAGGGGDPSGGDQEAATPVRSDSDTTSESAEEAEDGGSESGDRRPRRYTVKPGDTPSGIAEKVGIPLEELLDLNPEVDPQTLSPGQRLRLR